MNSRTVPTSARLVKSTRGSAPKPPAAVLALLLTLGAWPEIAAHERRYPSANLAAFWAGCSQGLWLLGILLALRGRARGAEAERFGRLHRLAAAAFWAAPKGREADAVRAAVDWQTVSALAAASRFSHRAPVAIAEAA